MSDRAPSSQSGFSPGLHKPALQVVSALVSCAFLVGISVLLMDRPVSTWVHEHLGDSRFAFFRMTYDGHSLAIGPFSIMAAPAEVLCPLALAILSIMAVAAAAGWRPKSIGRIIMVLSLSVVAAVEINRELKHVFGRTWPESWLGDNPSWIRDGAFGFQPFHGGPGWGSFPSGHTTVITTAATILWLVWPRLRVLWAATVAIVITGLVGANYHFISDILGGVYLGVGIGFGGAGLMLSRSDCVGRATQRIPAEADWPVANDRSMRGRVRSPNNTPADSSRVLPWWPDVSAKNAVPRAGLDPKRSRPMREPEQTDGLADEAS